jgi:PAS domain S-box-containing protein
VRQGFVKTGVAASPGLGAAAPAMASVLMVLPAVTSLCVLVAAAIVLGGWALRIDGIAWLDTQWPPMVPNTALGLLLCASALWVLRPARSQVARGQLAARLAAAAVALLGALTLAEYLLGINLGIDRAMLPAAGALAGVRFPGRPALTTALSLTLLGSALLLLPSRALWLRWSAHLLAILALLNAVRGLLAYLYENDAFFALTQDAGMALHTAMLCLLLSIGVICAWRESPLLAALVGGGQGSLMLRRSLPIVLLLSALLADLTLRGSQAGLFGSGVGLIALLAFNLAVIWWMALRVNSFERLTHWAEEELKHALKRRHAEDALRASEERLRFLIRDMHVGVVIHGPAAEIVLSNAAATSLLGLSEEQLLGKSSFDPDWNVIHEDGAPFPGETHPAAQVLASGLPVRDVVMGVYRPAHRDRVWLLVNAEPQLAPDGGVQQVIVTFSDISERKRAEERLTLALAEKSVLIQEIHHRVKNNLQIIASLLKLQADGISDPQAHALLRDSQNRVRSMALVHEHLYQAPDLARIDFERYVRMLMTHLARSYDIHVHGSQIQLEIQVDRVLLEVDTAIPCGLIINELVSNSFKYAFPSGRTGSIQVWFTASDLDRCTLTVRDSGVGLAPDFDLDTATSLGLQLVTMLTEQLGGTLAISGDGGTSTQVSFAPVYPVQRREHS